MVSVTSLWTDGQLYYPLPVEPGALCLSPAHHFKEGQAGPSFRTKLAIAAELIQRAVDAGIPFRAVVADCFYGEDRRVQQGCQSR